MDENSGYPHDSGQQMGIGSRSDVGHPCAAMVDSSNLVKVNWRKKKHGEWKTSGKGWEKRKTHHFDWAICNGYVDITRGYISGAGLNGFLPTTRPWLQKFQLWKTISSHSQVAKVGVQLEQHGQFFVGRKCFRWCEARTLRVVKCHMKPYVQWLFHEPKLEVPTI